MEAQANESLYCAHTLHGTFCLAVAQRHSSWSLFSVPLAGDLGSDCSSNMDCTVNNSICSNNVCTCDSGLTEYNGKCAQGK